jgi:hypothetical protein
VERKLVPTIVRYWRAVITASLCISVLQAHGAVATTAEKRANIETRLEDTGMLTNLNRVIDLLVPQLMGSLKKSNQKTPTDAIPSISWSF